MKHIALMLLCGLMACSPGNAYAEQLTFVTSEWPPYAFVKNGQLIGSQVEIVREICKRLGIEADIQLVPWARAINMVKNGDADAIFPPVKTAERLEFLEFTTEALTLERNVVLAREGSGITVTQLDDLKEKRIGVVREYEYGEEFDQRTDLTKEECRDDALLMRLLDNERIDVALGDEDNLKFLGNGLQHRFEVVYVLSETPDYIGFSKQASGERASALAEQFSQIMRQLKEEGVYEQIRQAYFKNDEK